MSELLLAVTTAKKLRLLETRIEKLEALYKELKEQAQPQSEPETKQVAEPLARKPIRKKNDT